MLEHAPSPQRLRELASALAGLDLRVAGDSVEERRRRAAAACGDYLAPRLEDPAGMLALVVVGPGGGGKSTLVNSLARRRISETGPVRPTTLEPVAWTDGTMPKTLDVLRSRLPGSIVDSLRPPPDGIVLIDAPPPEVTDAEGRSVAAELLAVADGVVFVAGVSRYADADAFELLRLAADRGLPTVLVLNRLPRSPEMQQEIARDFSAKLAERRLLPRSDPDLVVTVSESVVSADTGGLMPEEIARVRKEIEAMADPQGRPDVVAAAVTGTLQRLRADLTAIRSAVIEREVRRVELLDPMRAVFRAEGGRLVAEVKGGKFAGEEPRRALDAIASAAARRAGLAARAAAEAWNAVLPGFVDSGPWLYGHGPDTLEAARERIRFWVDEIEPLIDRMSTRRMSGRRRRRLADHVRRAALDPRTAPSRTMVRLLRRAPGIVAAARDLLAEELRGMVDADSMRFEERVGPEAPAGILAELIEEGGHE